MGRRRDHHRRRQPASCPAAAVVVARAGRRSPATSAAAALASSRMVPTRGSADQRRSDGSPRHTRGSSLPRRAAHVAGRRTCRRSARGCRGGEQRFGDAFGREWSRKLYDGGYAGLTWPKEYGGAGAPYSFQAIFYEEMARAQAPPHVGVIGLGMAGPTIMAHGTEEQKQAHLSKILSGEEIWCQGFSEPGAGSDLAAARTRMERKRRRLRRQRPEGVVVVRAHRRLVHPRRPERPGRAALQGPQLHDRRHARARRRGAAAAADHRRGGVQRDLLHRRRGARPRTCSARRARAGRSR